VDSVPEAEQLLRVVIADDYWHCMVETLLRPRVNPLVNSADDPFPPPAGPFIVLPSQLKFAIQLTAEALETFCKLDKEERIYYSGRYILRL
jgi:hypothetical protein